MDDEVIGKAKGAFVLAESMTPEERKQRAAKAANAEMGEAQGEIGEDAGTVAPNGLVQGGSRLNWI